MQKLNLRELKGAPLSIILAIVMAGNRTVSVSYLCTETGYSDKTVSSGLELLRGRQIVTETRRNHYQLTGNNVQLPLYWNERIEPADPSPASIQAELPGFEAQTGKISGENFQSGKFPVKRSTNDLIRDHEARISALEAEIAELKSGKIPNFGNIPNDPQTILSEKYPESGEIPEQIEEKSSFQSGNSPKNGENPDETGEFLNDDFKSSSSINPDYEINNHDDENEYQKNFLETYETLKAHTVGLGMITFDDKQLDRLIELHADLELVEFVLSAAGSFDAAAKWLRYKNVRTAKYKFCETLGIYRKYQQEFADRDDITLHAIAFHYWKWRLKEADNEQITLGTVISRIKNHFDQMKIESSWPLMCGYLD